MEYLLLSVRRTSLASKSDDPVNQGIRRKTNGKGGNGSMKIMITQHEALEKGIWKQVMSMFGITNDDEIWETEQFILTEEQAKELGLIR